MLDFRERDPRGFWTKRGEKKRESNIKEERKAIVKQGFVFDQLPQDTKTKEAFETALGMQAILSRNCVLNGWGRAKELVTDWKLFRHVST